MTSRELVIHTLNHEPTARAPRDLWFADGMETTHCEAVAEMNLRFPGDIIQPDIPPSSGKRARGKPNQIGQYTDSWGCTWQILEPGTPAELKISPLAEKGKIAEFRPPLELLDPARFSKVNKSCENTGRFVLARSESRLFDRLRFLRGADAALIDLARGTKDIRNLLKMLHEFACKEMEMWSNTEVDGVVLRDDWGTADSLLISPEMWREIFKPLYSEYCKILHAKDKFVFFQSNGNMLDIVGDLIKDGVDAIHMQLHLMDLEKAAKRRGRVTFWGEIASRGVLRSGNPAEQREEVLKIRRSLDFGSGGVIAQCQWDPDVPLQTIAAVFEQWLLPLPMHA